MGILAGATMGGSKAAGSIDAMLHDMIRLCNGSRRQVDIEVVRELDGWPARRWEFGRQGHAGAKQVGLGEDGPKGGPRLLATAAR
jgi:hypothetical protein